MYCMSDEFSFRVFYVILVAPEKNRKTKCDVRSLLTLLAGTS